MGTITKQVFPWVIALTGISYATLGVILATNVYVLGIWVVPMKVFLFIFAVLVPGAYAYEGARRWVLEVD